MKGVHKTAKCESNIFTSNATMQYTHVRNKSNALSVESYQLFCDPNVVASEEGFDTSS